MSVEARSWLPEGAFGTATVDAVLADVLCAWSAQWFARRTATVSYVRPHDAAHAAPGTAQLLGERAALQLPARGKRLLLEALLDTDLSQQILGEGDRRVLDDLTGQVLDDLVVRLDKFFEAEARHDEERRLSVGVVFGTGELLIITVPDHILVPALRARVSRSEQARAPLRKRLQALAETKIVAEAVLGHVELSMSDIEALDVGDVLVLDRALEEPIDLYVSGKPLARAKLARNGQQFSLQL